MERICIIGGSGTGKSTLSTNLGKELNLPVFHIDGINYLENWKQRDQKERDKIILETTNEPKWIMDGTYRSTLEQRLERSDFIIFLDFSSLTQIISVMKRYLTQYDNIIIGSPCWFGTYAPPINTFLSDNKIENKNIYLFVCNGGNLRNTWKNYDEALKENNIVSKLDLIYPIKNGIEEAKENVNNWLKSNLK